MADGFDRFKGALADLVRQLTGHTDFHALYPATVKAQNDDNTLELKPDGTKLPGFSKVPIRHGLPGITVRVVKNARVLLGFEGGDPQRPYAALWSPGSLESITVEASVEIWLKAPSVVAATSKGNAKPPARRGDLVKVTGVCGPPGSPLELVGYILDGAEKTLVE